MKKLHRRLSKRSVLILDALVLLLLLALLWVLLDYPALTPGGAFRRGMKEAGLPALSMELRENDVGLAADDGNVYLVELDFDRGWRARDAWTVPAEQGVLWAPLNWPVSAGWHYKWEEPVPDFAEEFRYTEGYYEDDSAFPFELPETLPAFAVKAEAADAGLTLTLEDWEGGENSWPQTRSWQGGSWGLPLLERKNGWLIFGFDTEALRAEGRFETAADGEHGMWVFDEPADSLAAWIRSYKPWYREVVCPASLTLRLRSGASDAVETITWELPTAVSGARQPDPDDLP